MCVSINKDFIIVGTPNRDLNFGDKSRRFEAHSNKLANTARMVATAGGCNNKKTVEAIQNMAYQVSMLPWLQYDSKSPKK